MTREVVQGQPLEEVLPLRAQRIPAPKQEQRQRQVGSMDDVILDGTEPTTAMSSRSV